MPTSEYENTIVSTSRKIGGFIGRIPRWTSNSRLVISESVKLLLRNGQPEHPYRWMLHLAMKYRSAATESFLELPTTMAPAHRSGTEVAEVAPPQNIDDALAHAEDMAVVLANAGNGSKMSSPCRLGLSTKTPSSRLPAELGVSSTTFPVGLRTAALLSPSP